MDPNTAITLAITLINQGAKVVEAANAGNLEEAERLLREARQHFDSALAGWDAA